MEAKGKVVSCTTEEVQKRDGSSMYVVKIVLEYYSGEYRNLWYGEKLLKDNDRFIAPMEGDVVTVQYDSDAHEYNGRWYQRNRVWKVEAITEQA